MSDDFDDDNNHSDEEEAPTLAQRQQAMKSRMNLEDVKAVNCHACGKKVFEKEKIQVDGKTFHRLGCFKCAKCKMTLVVGKHAALKGVFYCVPHYSELLKAAGGKIDKVGADLQLDSAAIVKGEREQQATAEAQKFAASSSDRIKEARDAGTKAAADKARLEKEAEKTQATYDTKKQQSAARVLTAREQAQAREKEEEVKKKAAEEEAKKKAESKKAEEAKKKADEEKQKEDAKKKTEEEARKKSEESAKKKSDEEAKKKDDEAKKKDDEAKKKAEEEARKKEKAEEEAKKKAEEEAKKKAEEAAQREAEKTASAASTSTATPKWQKLTTDEGDTYYYNSATDESVWEKPADYEDPDAQSTATPAAPAPAAAAATWQKLTTDTGDVYYFNAATGESVWDQPADYHE